MVLSRSLKVTHCRHAALNCGRSWQVSGLSIWRERYQRRPREKRQSPLLSRQAGFSPSIVEVSIFILSLCLVSRQPWCANLSCITVFLHRRLQGANRARACVCVYVFVFIKSDRRNVWLLRKH